jgi:hypothetical protein
MKKPVATFWTDWDVSLGIATIMAMASAPAVKAPNASMTERLPN